HSVKSGIVGRYRLCLFCLCCLRFCPFVWHCLAWHLLHLHLLYRLFVRRERRSIGRRVTTAATCRGLIALVGSESQTRSGRARVLYDRFAAPSRLFLFR